MVMVSALIWYVQIFQYIWLLIDYTCVIQYVRIPTCMHDMQTCIILCIIIIQIPIYSHAWDRPSKKCIVHMVYIIYTCTMDPDHACINQCMCSVCIWLHMHIILYTIECGQRPGIYDCLQMKWFTWKLYKSYNMYRMINMHAKDWSIKCFSNLQLL